jgi:hypothetical protein
MEANQITCPQCGLANNKLAESCVQCGIIFIKNPVMSTQTIKDDEKRKAIEEAEAMLDETQAPPEIDAFKNEIVKRPDPHEDTVEIQIPKEETTDIKPEAALPEASKPEEDQNSENQEIEMEAIEAEMETVDGTVDAEALFLSEVSADESAETVAPETVQSTAGTPSETEKADELRVETLEAEAKKEDNQKPEVDALTVGLPEENPLAEPQKEENQVKKEPAETKSETAEAAETATAVAEVVESAKSEDHSLPADAAPPKEQEIQIEEKHEPTTAEAASTKAEKVPHPNATIEMPEELVEAAAEADEQAEKTKKDALKKQQEAQAKAEALEKEKAAQAVALKKKKLAQAQALACLKETGGKSSKGRCIEKAKSCPGHGRGIISGNSACQRDDSG